MAACPTCNKDNPDDYKVCAHCGAEAPPILEQGGSLASVLNLPGPKLKAPPRKFALPNKGSLPTIELPPKTGLPTIKTTPQRKPKAVSYATLDEEREALNTALSQAGLRFRVTNDDELRLAKLAADVGTTKSPVRDFDGFKERLIDALRIGAFQGIDADEGFRQEYANSFKAVVITLVPGRKKRLSNETFTFAQCVEIAQALKLDIVSVKPATLAKAVNSKIGLGLLAGIFPGETPEATAEQGGKERITKMVDLGRHIVERLREAGDVRPELTGSIVLSGGGYTGVPEDLDINVTTTGSEEDRKEQWETVLEIMNDFDGLTVAIPHGTLRIFPMAAGKISGENKGIWERRFGYVVKLEGEKDNRVLPFEVEVKDVGGDVWKEHLLSGADKERGTDEDGLSKPQWLMLDTMTRILGHRKNMQESAAGGDPDLVVGKPSKEEMRVWVEKVQQTGLDKSHEKRLWEKLNVAASMTRAQKKFNIWKWLQKTVKEPDAYLELLELADNEPKYEQWLTKVG